MPEVVLIAAMARDRVIGHEGRMPWHLPADLAHFKAVTLGHPVIMGRKTFESIGKALPGRTNIVISRSQPELPEGLLLADSLDAAIDMCADQERAMIIGGGEIYRKALALADSMELSFIDLETEGDTRFPDWTASDWVLVSMQVRPADEANPHRLVFCRFRRSCR